MKEIKVLGTGCTKCVKMAEFIQAVADEYQVDVQVVKETSPQVIMSYGVMSTPAVVVDGKLVHSGALPDKDKVKAWLTAEH